MMNDDGPKVRIEPIFAHRLNGNDVTIHHCWLRKKGL